MPTSAALAPYARSVPGLRRSIRSLSLGAYAIPVSHIASEHTLAQYQECVAPSASSVMGMA
eukprot:3224471-Rhodomonas_salina.1